MTSQHVPAFFGERQAGLDYRPRAGAYGIVLDGWRVLVIDTAAGRFLPGGGFQGNEPPLVALRRELREETGHDVLDAHPIGSASQLIVSRDTGEGIEKLGHYFATRLSPEAVAEPMEADHVLTWVDVDEAVATLSEAAQAWAVRRALDGETKAGIAAGECRCPADVDPRIVRYFDQRNRRRREGRETYALGEVSRGLLRALLEAKPEGRSVLEAGCGPGALIVELLAAGAEVATGIDLSPEAIEYARQRSAEAGLAERTTFVVADSATLTVRPHDWVVLDKVICCYADVNALLDNTLRAAGTLYAFAVPASYGWRGIVSRAVNFLENVTNSLRGRPCPGYVHDVRAIERRLLNAGFQTIRSDTVGLWHVGLYERAAA